MSSKALRSDNELLAYCRQLLSALGSRGTDLEIGPMAADTMGMTCFRQCSRPLIIINTSLRSESDTLIKTIVAHEYAHVIAGSSANHNAKWQAIANKFSRQLGGSAVTQNPLDTVSPSATFWLSNFSYVYCCQSCGRIIGFNDSRYSRLGAHVTHNGCGGSWKKIK